MTVRPATRVDIAGTSRVLARAFHDDPVMSWIFPDAERRAAKLLRFYAIGLRTLWMRNELVFTTDDYLGAAVWAPPGKWQISPFQLLRLVPAFLSLGGRRVGRVITTMRLIEHHHLKEPHYYLFAIGADPGAQGRGLGAALLQPVLARCDSERLPAYLESSNPRNITFYLRHGFRVLHEVAPPGGPPLTLMQRDVPR